MAPAPVAQPHRAARDPSPRPAKRQKTAATAFEDGVDFLSFDLSPEPEPARGKRSNETRIPVARTNGKQRANAGASKRKAIDLDLENESEARQGSHPWAHYVRWQDYGDATDQINAELGAFYDYMTPTTHEHQLRAEIIASVADVVTRRWPDAEVRPFGSFATQSYLPFGDIDLVVISNSMAQMATKTLLYRIAALLRTRKVAQDILVISRAKVPIVKFVTTRGLLRMDISINQSNGIRAVPIVNQLLTSTSDRAARAMVSFVKAYLTSRDLNEVYSGGISSFSIICLVVSFLQLHPRVRSGQIDPVANMGVLLLEFFELYGKCFNYDVVGISVVNGGSYFGKDDKGWQNGRNTLCMSIEDPGDPTNDIAQGAYNTFAIRQAFSAAYDILTTALQTRMYYLEYPDQYDPNQSPSLLGNVYAMSDADIRKRKQNAQDAARLASSRPAVDFDRYGAAATLSFRGPLAPAAAPSQPGMPPPPIPVPVPKPSPKQGKKAKAQSAAAPPIVQPASPNKQAKKANGVTPAKGKRKAPPSVVSVESSGDDDEADNLDLNLAPAAGIVTLGDAVAATKVSKKKPKRPSRPMAVLVGCKWSEMNGKERKAVRSRHRDLYDGFATSDLPLSKYQKQRRREDATPTEQARMQVEEAHGLAASSSEDTVQRGTGRESSSSPPPEYQQATTGALLGASSSDDGDSRYNVRAAPPPPPAAKPRAPPSGPKTSFVVASSSDESEGALQKAKSKAEQTRAFWQAKGPREPALVVESAEEEGEVVELSSD